ncbi:MAG: AAA family ATPase [Spirochaetes bacterium]|nr:AAA family ATPase [Spirochaetota bacterium]
MIKELRLKSFGKFRDAAFAFSPVTVFAGENESGKTTLFDAIFDNISRPKRTTTAGRRLAARYGEARESELVFDGSRIEIDQDEFINLHAIGAGNITLDLSTGGDWLERVKSSIFTGGVDPGMLASEFEKLASDNGTTAHMRKLKRLEEERRELTAALESLKSRKAGILSGEQNLRQRKAELDAVAASAERTEAALREKERLLEQQGKIREREGVVRAMELVARHAALEAGVRRLERYADDKTATLRSLSAGVDGRRAEKTRLAGEVAAAARQLDALAGKIAHRSARVEALKGRAFVASQLSATIESSAPRPVIRMVMAWKKTFLALAALPVAAGIAGFIMVPQKYLAVAALVGGAVIALVMGFFSRKTREVEESPDPSGFIQRLKDEWRARTGLELSSATVEGLGRELVAVQSECDAAAGELTLLREEESSARKALEGVKRDEAAADELLTAAVAALDRELSALGVRDPGEYAVLRGEYASAWENFSRLAGELDAEMKRLGAKTVDGLKAECELRAARLREEITGEKITDAEMTRLQRELAGLKQEEKTLAAKQASFRSAIDKGEGEVIGSLGDLPEQIHAKEIAIRKLDVEIAELTLDRKAAAVARDVFAGMAKDSDAVFAELGGDISRFMDGILPAGRHVALRDFDNGAVEIADAGGNLRSLADLSTGTRDSFCLAARLALALRSWDGEEKGIIVLDEPFHSLDWTRVERALSLLEKFHRDQGWQVVLFTKEQNISGTVKELIPEARVHRLSGGGKTDGRGR